MDRYSITAPEGVESPVYYTWDCNRKIVPGTRAYWLSRFMEFALEGHSDLSWEIRNLEWQLPHAKNEALLTIETLEQRLGKPLGDSIDNQPCAEGRFSLFSDGIELTPTDKSAINDYVYLSLKAESLKALAARLDLWQYIQFHYVHETELTPDKRADFVKLFENEFFTDQRERLKSLQKEWEASGFKAEELLNELEVRLWGGGNND